MRRTRIKKIITGFLTLGLCLEIFAVFILGNRPNGGEVFRGDGAFEEFNVEQPDIRQIHKYTDKEKRYSITLPSINHRGKYIFVYLIHQYAQVWLEDDLMAECTKVSDWSLGNSPGCYWLNIPVSEEDSGKQLRIITWPLYKAVENRDPRIIVSNWDVLFNALVKDSIGELVLCTLCVIAGLIFVISSPIIRIGFSEKRQFFCLGAFTVAVGMWRICDLPVMPLVFPLSARLLYFLTVASLMLMPVFFNGFLRWRRDGSGEKLYKLLYFFFAVQAAFLLCLQLLNIVDLRSALNYIFATVVISAIPIFNQSLISLKEDRRELGAVICDLVYIGFLVSALVDMYHYFQAGGSRFLSLLICVTCLHLVVMEVIIIRDFMERQKRGYAVEAELDKERTRLMLSQIQPHFLYNSLGVIRELCHSDPAKAEDATVMFSQYLRQNMESLSVDGPINFSDELLHVKNYLQLEQLRFADYLCVKYDIKATNFRLPTLTLQPVVENAVRHGVRKRIDGGMVIIRSEEKECCWEVLVEDNGPGFNPENIAEDDNNHIGLKNVSRRLKYICGGRLSIESVVGVGTRVSIIIPKRSEENDNIRHG